MNIGELNRAIAYANDIAQVGVDMTKRDGNTIGGKMQNAGINLFENTASTTIASRVYDNTGSSSAYIAKYAAGNDSRAAMEGSMRAGIFADMLYNHPWGFYNQGYYGCSMWDNPMICGGGFAGGQNYGNIQNPRFNEFNNNNFFRHW